MNAARPLRAAEQAVDYDAIEQDLSTSQERIAQAMNRARDEWLADISEPLAQAIRRGPAAIREVCRFPGGHPNSPTRGHLKLLHLIPSSGALR